MILIPLWQFKGSHLPHFPYTCACISCFPEDETLHEGSCIAARCWTVPTPHDVTSWRHEDRQLWPLLRFTKPLSRGWHYSQGGDNPCAAALMTQDAPLGYPTGWWRFTFRCFMYSFRSTKSSVVIMCKSTSVDVAKFRFGTSKSTVYLLKKYIREDFANYCYGLVGDPLFFRLLPKEINIRTGLQIPSFYLLLWLWNLVSQNKQGNYLDWGQLVKVWGGGGNIWISEGGSCIRMEKML
jgi:hypothetical protein